MTQLKKKFFFDLRVSKHVKHVLITKENILTKKKKNNINGAGDFSYVLVNFCDLENTFLFQNL